MEIFSVTGALILLSGIGIGGILAVFLYAALTINTIDREDQLIESLARILVDAESADDDACDACGRIAARAREVLGGV